MEIKVRTIGEHDLTDEMNALMDAIEAKEDVKGFAYAGSGKSTFTYFIEFCLGNNIKYFEKGTNKEYTEIVNDTNNFVELDIIINSKKYQLKRFINKGDIFINDGHFHIRKISSVFPKFSRIIRFDEDSS